MAITERWPYNGNRRPWPYQVSSTRFFKTPNGLISDTRLWPYNQKYGTNAIVNMTPFYDLHFAKMSLNDHFMYCRLLPKMRL